MNERKPAGSKTRDWIIRIVVFGALGVVLVLALLDYQAKTAAGETFENWKKLLAEANAQEGDAVLPLEKLSESMQGSPEVSESKNQNVYTWKGQFGRKYVINVDYETRLSEKLVTDLEVPAEPTEE